MRFSRGIVGIIKKTKEKNKEYVTSKMGAPENYPGIPTFLEENTTNTLQTG
jgi:hypothetical protein